MTSRKGNNLMLVADRDLQTVLFLCTGNWYRSRFAEELLNARVQSKGLPWTAQSRGLAIERGEGTNTGPIHPDALASLVQRGLEPDLDRFPIQVGREDFSGADKIIALDGAEHQPLVEDRFPQWSTKVEYWDVYDDDFIDPALALLQIEQGVDQLITRLEEQVNPTEPGVS